MGRTTRGVTLFKTAEDEKVVSVTRLREFDEEEESSSEDSDEISVDEEGNPGEDIVAESKSE
jgi:hypothetical protein